MRGRAAAIVVVALFASGCGSGGGITPIRTDFNKGVYHQSRGDLDAAIGAYRAALGDDPLDFRARFNLATALEAKAGAASDGAPLRAEARSHYAAILEDRPDDLRAAVNLAAAEIRDGEREAGEARLAAATLRHPDAALPRRALAAHRLAAGDTAGAMSALEAALARDPSDTAANMLLGDALARSGDEVGARAAYERALVREPDDLATLLALARLEGASGRGTIERALFIDPDNAAAHALAADVAEKAGDLESAVFHLWRARDSGGAVDPERLRALYQRLATNED